MVLSLNQDAGKIEPHKVKALLYMGQKPVYRITTESEKQLKTTLNHPYLTKEGWKKLKDIEAGEEIAVVNKDLKESLKPNFNLFYSRGRQFPQFFADEHFIYDDDLACFYQRGFGKMCHFNLFSGQEIVFDRNILWNLRSNSHNYYIGMGVVEGGRRYNYCWSLFESGKIRKRKWYKDDFSLTKGYHKYYPLGYSRSQRSFLLLLKAAGHPEKLLKDVVNPRGAVSALLFLIEKFPAQLFLKHLFAFSSHPDTKYITQPIDLSSISFEPIISIQHLGDLEVYDIEVKGTHNFVAEGIVAHNTYIDKEQTAENREQRTESKEKVPKISKRAQVIGVNKDDDGVSLIVKYTKKGEDESKPPVEVEEQVFGDKDRDLTEEIRNRQKESKERKDHVLCLTPDSLIELADGTKRPLIEIKQGNLVLSLNQDTGRLEPHKVKALLYMGKKPVYRITTNSGKQLKTTLNHPYLTKRGWRELRDIEVGEEIAVVRELLRPESASMSFNNKEFPFKLSFIESSEKVKSIFNNFFLVHIFNIDNYYSGRASYIEAQNIPKILVKGEENVAIAQNKFENFLIRSRARNYIRNSYNFKAFAGKSLNNIFVDTGVNQNNHKNVLYLGEYLGRVFHRFRGKVNSSDDVLFGNSRVLFGDIFQRVSCTNKIEDITHSNTSSLNTGLTKSDLWVNNNPSFEHHSITSVLENSTSVDNCQDIIFDPITSIEHIGNLHVYDIEVEGTHNFVAEGIVAHNTYIDKEQTAENREQRTKSKEKVPKISKRAQVIGVNKDDDGASLIVKYTKKGEDESKLPVEVEEQVFGDKDRDLTEEIRNRQKESKERKDHVLCLTPDSLIELSDGTKRPLIEIKQGNLVLSLNQDTGRLEPHKVKALL